MTQEQAQELRDHDDRPAEDVPISVSVQDVSAFPGSDAPAVLQWLRWYTGQHHFFNRNAERFGSAFRIEMPFLYDGRVVCFTTTTAAKEVLRLSPTAGHAGEAMSFMRETMGAHSVMLLDEDEHLRMRKLVLPPLHGERLKQWEAFSEQRTLQEIETWPVGEPFSLRPIAERLTLAVISKIVFGVRDPARSEELRELLPAVFDVDPMAVPGLITKLGRVDLGPWSPWGRFRRKRDRLHELICSEIADRRREFEAVRAADASVESRSDLLSMLLDARDEAGNPMTDAELRDQLVTLLVAGHETTATSIAWAVERLLRTPAVLRRLLVTLDAGETTYLDAVIKETMRIRPVVAQLGRVVTEQVVIDGWTVPARTLVVVPITVIHKDPEIYPDPEAFRPERFLDGNNPGSYAWLPFGGGTRRCPGASLALLEMRVILRTILRNVGVAPERPESEKETVRGIAIVPDRGARIVVTHRRRPAPAGKPRMPAAATCPHARQAGEPALAT